MISNLMFIFMTHPNIINEICKKKKMFDSEELFINQDREPTSYSPLSLSVEWDSHSCDLYVSQFLNFLNDEQQQSSLSQLEVIDLQKSSGVVLEPKKLNENENQQSEKQQKKKSLFHNFQKHLVITLRNIIQIRRQKASSQVINLSYKMWKIFINSNNYNKCFTHILFGNYSDYDQIDESIYYRYGYGSIIEKYTAHEIQKAQMYLRNQALRQFKLIDIEQYLSKRRMKSKIQFSKYISTFFDQMSEGNVGKRLSKEKTQALAENIIQFAESINNPEILFNQ